MTINEQSAFDCPSCNSPINLEENSNNVQCKVCSIQLELRDHLCPQCHSHHADDGVLCHSCGTPLSIICRNCHTSNWSGLKVCEYCGEPIDIIAKVSDRGSTATADRLNSQMSQAQAIKVVEEMASSKRMTELLAIEEARQAEVRQRIAKQNDQERKLLIIVFGAIALFLLILITYAIVSTVN